MEWIEARCIPPTRRRRPSRGLMEEAYGGVVIKDRKTSWHRPAIGE